MSNRKIAILMLTGAALAAQAGFAAADETEADFWAKNPRNERLVTANPPSASAQARADVQNTVPATSDAVQTRGPATNPVDQFYYRHSGGVPAA